MYDCVCVCSKSLICNLENSVFRKSCCCKIKKYDTQNLTDFFSSLFFKFIIFLMYQRFTQNYFFCIASIFVYFNKNRDIFFKFALKLPHLFFDIGKKFIFPIVRILCLNYKDDTYFSFDKANLTVFFAHAI